ncbi:MAG: alpha/beta fold hydrolase [Leadbetterella sp.]
MNIVFLHGFGEDTTVWEDFKPYLSTENTYHFPDFSKFKSLFSIAEYAEWLKKELDKKSLEKFVLIGHSMGGYISLEFATMFPERILGLGLFHSSAAPDSMEKKESRDKSIQFLIKHDTDLFIKHFYPNMFNEEFKTIHGDKVKNNIDKFSTIPNEALLAATLAMKSREGSLEALPSFTFPIFQIIGLLDTFVNYKDALHQTTLIQKPSVLLLHDIVHAGMYESPQACANFINDFFERVKKDT